MTKRKFTHLMAEKSDIYCYQAREWLNVFVDTLMDVLSKGDRVYIDGFGVFYVDHTRERDIKSGLDGEAYHVPSYTKIKFNPSKVFRDQLTEASNTEFEKVGVD